MSKPKPQPSEELLDKIEEIGNIKRELSLAYRSLSSILNLYVQSGHLPGGGVQYMAGGGKVFTDLVFQRRPDSTRTVRKYKPGDWELKVDDTLSLCRVLYRIDHLADEWPPEKMEAYLAERPVDGNLGERTVLALTQQADAVSAFIDSTSDEVKHQVATFILQELEREYPVEYLEFVMALGEAGGALAKQILSEDQIAYGLGYMASERWISWDEVDNWCLMAGYNRAQAVRLALGEDSQYCQCRANGFAQAFVALAKLGAAGAGATR